MRRRASDRSLKKLKSTKSKCVKEALLPLPLTFDVTYEWMRTGIE